MDLVTAILFGLGFVLLIGGATLLVRGASSIAAAAGISPLVIGLTVVAYGTGAPELVVSVNAAWRGASGVALGNVVGSNIYNVLFILGMSALIAPLRVDAQVVRREVPIMILVSLVVLVMAVDGRIGRIDGMILVAGAVMYTVYSVRAGRRASREEGWERPAAEVSRAKSVRQWLLRIGLVVVGLGLLVVGTEWLVDGATTLARALNVRELIIGLTIVAVGTGLPETATSIVATIRGQRDIAVGNVVGSNIFNLLFVLGIAALVSPIPVPLAARYFDLPVMTAVAIACLPIFFTAGRIGRWEGLLFLGYYVAYTIYLILTAMDHDALSAYRTAMLFFVVPLTVITLLVLVGRSLHRRDYIAADSEQVSHPETR